MWAVPCLGCVCSVILEQRSGGDPGRSPSPPVLLQGRISHTELSRAASVSQCFVGKHSSSISLIVSVLLSPGVGNRGRSAQ